MKGLSLPQSVQDLLTAVAEGQVVNVISNSPAHRAAITLSSSACGDLLVLGPKITPEKGPSFRPVCLRVVYEERYAEGKMGQQG